MQKIVKQAAGIDVAQKELVVSLCRMYDDWSAQVYAHKVFANTEKGFEALQGWVEKMSDERVPVRFVMEATGVYHEPLAYWLDEKGVPLTIVLPNKISSYQRTLDVRTVTDKTSSEAIARFGVERKLENWVKPKDIFRQMKQLTRERDQLVVLRTMAKNEQHAEQSEAHPHPASVARNEALIGFLNDQEREIRRDLAELIKTDNQVGHVIRQITTIPGIGALTAAIVLAETNGFELIRNKRQIVAYAGLDVKAKDSGTSVKGKPRISKKGNRHLRKAMHLPALAAIRHDERFKALFVRLVSRHGIKMKAAVAIQRKLLELIYTLYKTNSIYDREYFKSQEEEIRNQENDQLNDRLPELAGSRPPQ